VIEASGGQGGGTWDTGLLPPIGGSGGVSPYVYDSGMVGSSSQINVVSQPVPPPPAGGWSRESPNYGTGGSGSVSPVFGSDSYGKSGFAYIQIDFTDF
jgi:hypothetical protein